MHAVHIRTRHQNLIACRKAFFPLASGRLRGKGDFDFPLMPLNNPYNPLNRALKRRAAVGAGERRMDTPRMAPLCKGGCQR